MSQSKEQFLVLPVMGKIEKIIQFKDRLGTITGTNAFVLKCKTEESSDGFDEYCSLMFKTKGSLGSVGQVVKFQSKVSGFFKQHTAPNKDGVMTEYNNFNCNMYPIMETVEVLPSK